MTDYDDKRLIENMFTMQEPLGPIATPPQMQERRYRGAFGSVFDAENFLCSAGQDLHPNIVLGRRGAGKTAYLYYLNFENGFSFSMYLDTASVFREVAKKIATSASGAGDAMAEVENTAKAWRALIFTMMLKGFWTEYHKRRGLKDTPEMRVIERFLEKNGLTRIRSIKRLLDVMRRGFEEIGDVNLDFVQDYLDDIWWADAGFGEAWEAAMELMKQNGMKGALLVDSLEQFHINDPYMANALSGLLHLIGQLRLSYDEPVEITVCFQAELHAEFSRLSKNPEKDLQRVLSMHWDPIELLQICGHRMSLFLQHNGEKLPGAPRPLPDRPSREEVNAFWRQFFGERISNRFGLSEPTLPYILRHTQLLPRHLIAILNKIMSSAFAAPEQVLPVQSADVLRGVRLGEESICLGIISGFEMKYPQARDVIDAVLPYAVNLMSYAQLQKINNRYGKGMMDTDELVEMLVRMGILGTFERSTEIYDICRFDYTFNGSMPYSQDDKFGLHPAFAGQFGPQADGSGDGSAKRPIYPKETFDEPRTGVSALRV